MLGSIQYSRVIKASRLIVTMIEYDFHLLVLLRDLHLLILSRCAEHHHHLRQLALL